jgi:tetratricopeptide (TPR) repeat protein
MGRQRKSSKKDSSPKAQVGTREVSWGLFERFFLSWTAILILVHVLTMYAAPAFMWGVHFYHFHPVWMGWVMALFSLTLLIPGVGEFFYLKLETFAQKISRPFTGWGENKTFALLSLLSLPIFWFFRTKRHLLGDGMFRILDLPNGKIHLQEWLDGFIHLIFYRAMHKLVPLWTPELTYSVISILCGGLFVFLALKLSSFLGKSDLGKVLIFFFLITLGSVQLFFGYVESYTILQVMLLAYVLFAARYLLGKTSIFPVLVVFVISVGLHITSLIYIPSFIYLLLKRRKDESAGEKGLGKTISNAFIVAVLILASVLVILWVVVVAIGLEKTGKGIFILPLLETKTYPFGMFSLGHISEFVNQLLLLTPMGISLMFFFLFFKLRRREFRNRLINFLFLAAACALVYLFAFNFTLGSADWDLRSSPAIFFGLLGVLSFLDWGERRYALKKVFPEGKTTESTNHPQKSSLGWRRYRTWGLIFICFGLFHTIPWILINASRSKSLDRYLMIQEVDPHPVDEIDYNLYKIARILKWEKEFWEVVWLYRRAIERNPLDSLSWYNLAASYHQVEELDSAVVVLEHFFKIDPKHPKANWIMGNVLLRREEYAEALRYLEKGYNYLQDNPRYLYELGVALVNTNQVLAAGKIGLQILKLDPNYVDAYYLVGAACQSAGDIENAKKSWELILSVYPDDSLVIENLKSIEEYEKKQSP